MIGVRVRWQSIGRRVGAVLFSGFSMLTLQNCTQPLQTDQASVFDAEASKVSFAYDVAIDQIAYMSCAPGESGLDGGATFTFRAGAYKSTSGIQLKDTFFTEMGRKPIEKQIALLTASPANASTSLQLSIRAKDNYQSFLVSNPSSSAVNGRDYWNMFDRLGTSDMSDYLINHANGARVRYVRNGTVYGARMEGSLSFTKDVSLAADVRSRFPNSVILALTYSQASSAAGVTSGSETLARSPADVVDGSTANAARSVYGRGFELEFGQPTVATSLSSQFPANVLTGVKEKDLEGGRFLSNNGGWSCPTSLQYRIVRPEDAGSSAASCVKAPDPATLSTEQAYVRNMLRVEDWWVDWTNKCVMSKRSGAGCYGTITSVQYNLSSSCSTTQASACVHYVSICYR
jgi:hypothetical protein